MGLRFFTFTADLIGQNQIHTCIHEVYKHLWSLIWRKLEVEFLLSINLLFYLCTYDLPPFVFWDVFVLLFKFLPVLCFTVDASLFCLFQILYIYY